MRFIEWKPTKEVQARVLVALGILCLYGAVTL